MKLSRLSKKLVTATAIGALAISAQPVWAKKKQDAETSATVDDPKSGKKDSERNGGRKSTPQLTTDTVDQSTDTTEPVSDEPVLLDTDTTISTDLSFDTTTSDPLFDTSSSDPSLDTSLPTEFDTTEPSIDLSSLTSIGDGSGTLDGRALNPLGGRIRTFAGDVDSLGGRIRAFEGSLEPFIGRIRSFEGEVDAMGGRIRSFEGDIDPYKGNIRTFWGDLTPAEGELDPKVGRIRTFSDEFLLQASDILAHWNGSDTDALKLAMQALFDQGEAQWGEQVTAQTQLSFEDGFANDFFAKWGVDPNSLEGIEEWDAFKRQAFLLDWYDNLLNFSGMDQVDHWMNAVNWTPTVTQIQSGGFAPTIGLIDFFVPADADIADRVVYSGGYDTVDDMHGAAVGSLIASPHDGRGVMGIAPNSRIAAYNPFDETRTASWADVEAGIAAVRDRGADVINLSLGVEGYTLPSEWRDVFVNQPDNWIQQTIYVIAAGNDGISQTEDIVFDGAVDTSFIVVGSIDPNREISAFSNRPGTACLTEGGACLNDTPFDKNDPNADSSYLGESGLLMNRFIVAPGEMILVSDGHGGVTRYSGTSFAAPLVSGAIALIHERWPWLRSHPKDVAKAILESAQDLGAPGVDPIYGHGLLDIEASQSALDFNALTYYLKDSKASEWQAGKQVSASTLLADGFQTSWATDDMYFTAFERLVNSFRDFQIPLSERLFNSSVMGVSFQTYMYDRFVAWVGGTDGIASERVAFSDMVRSQPVPLRNGLQLSMSSRLEPIEAKRNVSAMKMHSTVEMAAPDNSFAVTFGYGDAAAILGGQANLARNDDYNPASGGANPLLGFASGGSHVAMRAQVVEGLDVSFGFTERDGLLEDDLANSGFAPGDEFLIRQRGAYQANAMTMRVSYTVNDVMKLSATVTSLNEEDAFHGVRSLETSDFGSGTRSNGLTIAADFDLGSGVSVFGSATAARSRSADDAALRLANARSTSFQAGVAKRGVFTGSDDLRITFAQPMALVRGSINFEQVAVVDRNTGEIGVVTESFDIVPEGPRRLVAEGLYRTSMLGGSSEFSLFARAELRPAANLDDATPNLMTGARFRIPF